MRIIEVGWETRSGKVISSRTGAVARKARLRTSSLQLRSQTRSMFTRKIRFFPDRWTFN